jgi:deoxyribodipyrimidine photolyase-related protein
MKKRGAGDAGAGGAGAATKGPVATLVVVFGDQLTHEAAAIREIDPARDVVLMMEVRQESTHVPSHAQRTIFFLSAMRHFAAELRERGVRVRYVEIDDPQNTHWFTGEVERAVRELRPQRIRCTLAGEHRVRAMVDGWAEALGIPVEVLEDEHFLTSRAEFASWAEGRRELVMEFFYRRQRQRLGILVDEDGKPEGGEWNLDKDNRRAFPKTGPKPRPPAPRRFEPDAITLGVMDAVGRVLPELPGKAASFAWPVTRADALLALRDFIEHRLALFGPFEDAMWTDEPFVYHSLLSPLLNVKLLNPRECVEAAVVAWKRRKLPLQSVEGFVRQLIGWREYIRGVYDFEGPAYGQRNSLGQEGTLPGLYWDGATDMNCLKHCVGQVLEHGFGHHIQRLMVTGNFALIAGVHARAISDWYLGMYIDGVDWATLPNTLGMSQHADARPGQMGGVVGTKPYASSGKYIQKMSNYCAGCRYDIDEREGERACPFNTLYWDFLIRHEGAFKQNNRMALILKHVEKMTKEEKVSITVSAGKKREALGISGGPGGAGGAGSAGGGATRRTRSAK